MPRLEVLPWLRDTFVGPWTKGIDGACFAIVDGMPST